VLATGSFAEEEGGNSSSLRRGLNIFSQLDGWKWTVKINLLQCTLLHLCAVMSVMNRTEYTKSIPMDFLWIQPNITISGVKRCPTEDRMTVATQTGLLTSVLVAWQGVITEERFDVFGGVETTRIRGSWMQLLALFLFFRR